MHKMLMILPLVALSACIAQDMPDPSEGQRLYAENCAMCHGVSGQGDGDLAQDMAPAPADLTVITREAGGVFPTAQVLSQIDGYTRMQGRDQIMPEYGALLVGDTVPVQLPDGAYSPVPRPLAALVTYLESIQR